MAAAREEVRRKTVFDAVGGMAQLMKLAYGLAIVGDDEAEVALMRVGLRSRTWFAEPDPAKRLALYAALVVAIDRRIVRDLASAGGRGGQRPP